MKRFLTVFLAVIVALGATFALTACGNEQGEGRTYTITYELNGGINDPKNPANYTIATETITLRPATKEGCLFVRWENENGDTVTEIRKGSTGNIVLKACWKMVSVTLKFDLENTLRRETYKSEVGFYPFKPGFDGYKQLTVDGKTSVSDIRATIGEALGDKLPEIDKISGSNDWSTFGWVYKTGDTYALLKAADVIDAEKLSAVDGVVTLYGCVKSNWIGPY